MKTAKQLLEALNPADNMDINPEVFSLLEDIAAQFLGIDTLKTQNSDDKDFHDCSVWSLAEALYDAYQHGKAAAKVEEKE